MAKRFGGKVALITGAGSGIGEAIAKRLAAEGAGVVLADIDGDGLDRVRADIDSAGGAVRTQHLDVSDASAHQAVVRFAEEKFGALHLAVNNAGIGGPSAPVGEYPLEGWHQVMNVNLNGVFYGLREQIPALLRAGGGAIVNMSSILGSVGFANASAYVSAKHALVGLTKAAAMEYADKGVRVNAVGPAFIDTPLLSNNLPPEALAGIAAMHPVKRLGRPEEVAALTCFLLADEASFITGSYHLVDGAYCAQ
ncbi:SDR family NAD(P)-dependent oxidoreductase [Cucumibacter marinus]|uniref:SDR family NAD(P)-dependent oxidoreductase n=1 Tax=Cucumibacter marinus TaxID=1121252 RepID=UPI0003FB29D7|nr:SDR family NAD(P)-dependent oxidoreductase [Cucumibacter marinus]